MKKWKVAILVVVLAGIIGSVVAYKMWHKPHTKVEDVKGLEVSAKELSTAYADDETRANEEYLNKAITVTGEVAETEENQDGKLVVILAGADDMTTVQCTMRDNGVGVSEGGTITIKGFCNGSSLFGVLLSDCVIVK